MEKVPGLSTNIVKKLSLATFLAYLPYVGNTNDSSQRTDLYQTLFRKQNYNTLPIPQIRERLKDTNDDLILLYTPVQGGCNRKEIESEIQVFMKSMQHCVEFLNQRVEMQTQNDIRALYYLRKIQIGTFVTINFR